MTGKQIEVGKAYEVKVSGKVVPVVVTGTFGYRSGKLFKDGWTAVNTTTGRAIRVKSPQRFRSRSEVTRAAGHTL